MSTTLNTTQVQGMSNYTDDGGIVYSYTLESDNSRYVLWSLVLNFSELTYVSFWVAYASIIFGGLVLLHSYIINKRNMNFVRFVADMSAFCSIIFAMTFLVSAIRPNKTKTAIAWDLFATGFCTIGIQLCDAYLFFNRYRAVAVNKMSKEHQRGTHLYIILVIVLPYYSTVTFLPLFADMNNNVVFIDFGKYVYIINTWGTILYDVYFTVLFSYLAYICIQKSNSFARRSNDVEWIIFKSLCHCVTSTVANALIYFSETYTTFLFDSSMYNIMIVFGIHFFFNFKIEKWSFMKQLLGNRNVRSEKYMTVSRKLVVVKSSFRTSSEIRPKVVPLSIQ